MRAVSVVQEVLAIVAMSQQPVAYKDVQHDMGQQHDMRHLGPRMNALRIMQNSILSENQGCLASNTSSTMPLYQTQLMTCQ